MTTLTEVLVDTLTMRYACWKHYEGRTGEVASDNDEDIHQALRDHSKGRGGFDAINGRLIFRESYYAPSATEHDLGPSYIGLTRQSGIDAWDMRHGQPYQAALEAHVNSYREDPPLYDSDESESVRLLALVADKVGRNVNTAIYGHRMSDSCVCIYVNDLSESGKFGNHFGMTFGEAALKCAYYAIPESERVNN